MFSAFQVSGFTMSLTPFQVGIVAPAFRILVIAVPLLFLRVHFVLGCSSLLNCLVPYHPCFPDGSCMLFADMHLLLLNFPSLIIAPVSIVYNFFSLLIVDVGRGSSGSIKGGLFPNV